MLYDNFPQSSRSNEIMCNTDILDVQALLVHQRSKPARISKRGCLSQYFAMVDSTFAAY